MQYGFKTAKKAEANLERWSLNQLRHSRGTSIRKIHGVEASRVSLGHARLEATEIYSERDLELAVRIAREMG
ncbi:MAG: hypothetical protein IH991_11260 [Planctomycetes bacterium]|nr:hypothetical protein [Planctomycetota bacterium]